MLEELSGVAISMTHELLIVPEADAPGSVFRHGRRTRSVSTAAPLNDAERR
jgi:hypothetical protein